MNIYLDFDGTVVEHKYPNIGRYNIGSIEIIRKLQNSGHKIILNTYRANCNNNTLQEALELINEKYGHILIKPITEYTFSKIYPNPLNWDLIKINNELFIDDISPNIPLNQGMVDWYELDRQFEENGLYKINK